MQRELNKERERVRVVVVLYSIDGKMPFCEHIYRFIVALWFNKFHWDQILSIRAARTMHRFSNSFFVTKLRVFELHFDASMFPSNISIIIVVLINIQNATEHLSSFSLLFNNWLNALLFDRIYSEYRLLSSALFFLSLLLLFCSIWYPEYFAMVLIHYYYLNHSIFTFSMPISDVAHTHIHSYVRIEEYITMRRVVLTPFLFKRILNLYSSHLRTIETDHFGWRQIASR